MDRDRKVLLKLATRNGDCFAFGNGGWQRLTQQQRARPAQSNDQNESRKLEGAAKSESQPVDAFGMFWRSLSQEPLYPRFGSCQGPGRSALDCAHLDSLGRQRR
jgi:hypothetical protein